jgi:hypothetical protein
MLPPSVTVMTRSQSAKVDAWIKTLWLPAVKWIVDGVDPMYLPSTKMSANEGVEDTETVVAGWTVLVSCPAGPIVEISRSPSTYALNTVPSGNFDVLATHDQEKW